MAKDAKYGSIEIPGVPDDEPVFVLRAKDVLSYGAIMNYQSMAVSRRCPEEFIGGLDNVLETFAEWADTNADKMKVPD